MTVQTLTSVLDLNLEAQARNQRQALLIANPTAECDSLVEHFQQVARGATPHQRAHLTAALELLRALAGENCAEGELQREIAGTCDQLINDGWRAFKGNSIERPWSARRVVKELRDPLATLVNPVIRGDRNAAALATVQAVLSDAPASVVLSVKVRHELGVTKFTRLAQIHAETMNGTA